MMLKAYSLFRWLWGHNQNDMSERSTLFLKGEGVSETETRHRCEDDLIEMGCGLDSSGSRQNPGADSCEHGNETSVYKDEELTD
jgi:hypothetical protein